MRGRVFSFLTALCLLLLLPVSAGCQGKGLKRYQTESFAYFDTVTTVIGYAENEASFLAEAAVVFEELSRYHRLFDIYHAYEGLENLYTVNEVQNGVHRTVTVDAHVIEMLLFAKEMYEKTAGALNVGMGSVLTIWHSHRAASLDNPENPTLPSDAELADAALHTAFEHVIIDKEHCTVTITDPEMTLDVGAIAKGYATERVAESMTARGLAHYILNVGGTVRAVGARADGNPWIAGIENPGANAGATYLAEVRVTDKALSTSGTYQRYYTVNGMRYHHIIDPKTSKPATGYLSVSVLADDTALADALSTALFCMSVEEGTVLLSTYPNAAALWVRADGSQHKSAHFSDFLK